MTSEAEQTSKVEPIGTLGGYELLEVLSRSIVTTVYRGWQPSLNRPVLIKQLHPQLAAEKDIRARFEREARVIARVRQDNIVNIYDFSASPDAVFLVLEWVEGYNLAQILKRGGNIPAPIASLILLEILKGLEVAHNQEVIHRDIKPENILISKDGRIKISDFGLALFKDSPSITQQGMVIGTPSFMAPETITGGLVDARTDLFALGASFYELLTGERIFSGTTFSESLHLVLTKHPDKPSQKVRDIPQEIDRLVYKLLEKDSRKRYASASEVTKQLRAIFSTYNWPNDPNLIKDYIADPAGFRLPKPVRSPLRRGKTLVVWGAVMLMLGGVALFLHNMFQHVASTIVSEQNDTLRHPINHKNDSNFVKHEDSVPAPVKVATNVSPPVKRDSTVKAGSATGTNGEENKKPPKETTGIVQPVVTPPVVPPEKKIVRNGYLRISSDPWSVMETGSVRLTLPVSDPVVLTAGEHVLTFTNPKFPVISKRVMIAADSTLRYHIELWKEVGAVSIGAVSPWADIYINNVKVASTPIADPIPVAPGAVVVKLVNPQYPPHQIQLQLHAGETSVRIQWDFENPTP